MKKLTQKELLAKLKALGEMPEEQRNDVVCALIGHSIIQSTFFGYFNCGRCKAQLGDTLAGVYEANSVVVIGHDCDLCRKNYKTATWRDKLFVQDPFAKEPAVA